MARITSELFVSQLVRRVFSAGGFAAIGRKGAEMAGAVFVIARPPGEPPALYAPAVQTLADEGGGRRFMREAAADDAAIAARLEREARFDPDYRLVEIEIRDAESFIDVAAED